MTNVNVLHDYSGLCQVCFDACMQGLRCRLSDNGWNSMLPAPRQLHSLPAGVSELEAAGKGYEFMCMHTHAKSLLVPVPRPEVRTWAQRL